MVRRFEAVCFRRSRLLATFCLRVARPLLVREPEPLPRPPHNRFCSRAAGSSGSGLRTCWRWPRRAWGVAVVRAGWTCRTRPRTR